MRGRTVKAGKYLACDSSSLLMRCIWNIRSPPFTNSITKNKLEQNDISVHYSTKEIEKTKTALTFISNYLYFSLVSPADF